MDCLILNQDFRPLSFLPLSAIPWQQAIRLSFLDKISVLEHYEDRDIHSPSQTFKMPALAVTREFMKYNQTVKFSRKAVYLRDLYTCGYCDEVFADKDLTLDHVVPQSRGGKTSWTNITTACVKCNHAKGNKQMLPNRMPFKPEYWHIVGNSMKNPSFQIKHPSWKPYLNYEE